jgi:FMN reductase
MSKVVIISGTPAKVSRLNGVTEYAVKELVEAGASVEWIHVADLPAEDLIRARFDSPSIMQANALVEQADAVIIASPVYKASYTGVLKTYLDLLPQKGLSGKIVLPLFIGGSIAHLLAVDYALKPVLSVLGAQHLLGGVYAVDNWVTRNEQGGYDLSVELAVRLEQAIKELVEEIQWLSVRKEKDARRSG